MLLPTPASGQFEATAESDSEQEDNDNTPRQSALVLDGTGDESPRRFSFGGLRRRSSSSAGNSPTHSSRRGSLGPIDEHDRTMDVGRVLFPITRSRGASLSSPLVMSETPSRVEEQQVATPTVDGYPIIVQSNRLVQEEGPEQEPPKFEQWGTRDPVAKLKADEAMEAYKKRKADAAALLSISGPQKIELINAVPPEDSPEPKKKKSSFLRSPFKIRKSSISSLDNSMNPKDYEIEARKIYLTPYNKIPVYPRVGGTAEYYVMQKRYPLFKFEANGYLTRSNLTETMVRLFSNPSTAPEWASIIPDIPTRRVNDPAVGEWVRYWETLIIKADILRGCELAARAAEVLRVQKQAEMHAHLLRSSSG